MHIKILIILSKALHVNPSFVPQEKGIWGTKGSEIETLERLQVKLFLIYFTILWRGEYMHIHSELEYMCTIVGDKMIDWGSAAH